MPDLTQTLLKWYETGARRLPWRENPHPYAVWVSEIMLQQTQVETVIPYYERWMRRFPNPLALAQASLQEVLQMWEGLGYYSRARHLHSAAGIVVEKFGAELPRSRHELERLPGIGAYTAAAILSIAYGEDAVALDGNLRRVLARLFNVDLPARSASGERRLLALAEAHLPPGRAGDYNQALMDLGALVCTPRAPDCSNCPLKDFCQARLLSLQESRPVLQRKLPVPHITVTAAVIRRDGRVLVARRPPKGLLGGMWEFPGGKLEAGESLSEGLQREILEELGAPIAVGEAFGIYRHAYTHFKVTLHAFLCKLIGPEPQPLEASELRWATLQELADLPMGKIDRLIARRLSPSALGTSPVEA